MTATRFELSLNMYDEQEEPLRTVKVEVKSVLEDQAKHQPRVTVTDRDTGFSMNVNLPKADYAALKKAVEGLQHYCDAQTIQKATLSIIALFSPVR